MKIFICASKHNYGYVSDVKDKLEKIGHIVTVPNCYDDPMKEKDIKKVIKDNSAL